MSAKQNIAGDLDNAGWFVIKSEECWIYLGKFSLKIETTISQRIPFFIKIKKKLLKEMLRVFSKLIFSKCTHLLKFHKMLNLKMIIALNMVLYKKRFRKIILEIVY